MTVARRGLYASRGAETKLNRRPSLESACRFDRAGTQIPGPPRRAEIRTRQRRSSRPPVPGAWDRVRPWGLLRREEPCAGAIASDAGANLARAARAPSGVGRAVIGPVDTGVYPATLEVNPDPRPISKRVTFVLGRWRVLDAFDIDIVWRSFIHFVAPNGRTGVPSARWSTNSDQSPETAAPLPHSKKCRAGALPTKRSSKILSVR